MILRKEQRSVARRSAFTLLEILVVVAIIVVLAGVGATYLLRALDDAKADTAYTQVKSLSEAVGIYYTKTGNYPNSLQDLANSGNIKGDAIIDPWGHPYQYDASGQHNGGNEPDIFCVNPKNGQQIGNWPGGKPQKK